MAGWIPTGFRWFSKDAVNEDWELGKFLRANADVMGDLVTDTARQRYAIFIGSAVGDDLDVAAAGFGFTREAGEDDDIFANRVATALVRNKVTPEAMIDLVDFASSGTVAGEIYEPWRDLLFFGDDPRYASLSGKARFGDEDYTHGAVFELQTDGPVPKLDQYLEAGRAAGVKYWLAIVMESHTDDNLVPWFGVELNNDPLALILPGNPPFKMNFITSDMEYSIESVGAELGDPYGDFQPWVMEMPIYLDVAVNVGALLTWCSPLRFDNVPGNYLLAVDMLASSSSGTPVYFVQQGSFDPWSPTALQGAPEITYTTTFDDGASLDDPGLVLG